MNKILASLTVSLFLLTLMSCAGTTSRQQTGTGTGIAVGAGVGAILGQVIGRDTKGTLIGAGIGAALGGLAGNQIAAYMDRQEQALRNAMASSEAANIQRNQDVLTAAFKSDIFFGFDSSTLKPGADSEIARVANVLNSYPQTTITVEGHTDAKGSEAYNQTLSLKRAEAVKNALIQKGVAPGRVMAVGYGESQPIYSDDAMNRRVNIVITPIRQG